MSDFIESITRKVTREALELEEKVAREALALDCAYVAVSEFQPDTIDAAVDALSFRVVTSFKLLPDVHPVQRLRFDSWDAYQAWEQAGRPL